MKTEPLAPTEPLTRLGRLETACKEGGLLAIDLVKKRFEKTPDPIDQLDYHNSDHAIGVADDAVRILTVISEVNPAVGRREIALARFFALSHDRVIKWKTKSVDVDGQTMVLRIRDFPRNEIASLGEAVQFMRETNILQEDEIFGPEDVQDATAAFWATIPDFDKESGTVIQPYLTPDTPVIARAVALADLGTAGLQGGAKFLQTSLALFREDNIDISQTDLDAIDSERRNWIANRIFIWLSSQGSFVDGRQIRLGQELAGLSDKERRAVSELFDKFDDTKQVLNDFIKEARDLSFSELISAVGY